MAGVYSFPLGYEPLVTGIFPQAGLGFVLRLCGYLLSLFFEDDGDEDGAVPVEPIEGEDMHAGGQAYVQTKGTVVSETALPGHSTFEVPGMPLHSSQRFAPDALSGVSAPAYAAFQKLCQGRSSWSQL